MESRHRPAEALSRTGSAEAPHQPSAVTAIRLAAACVLLFGLAFIQDPGFLVADTKFDLVAAPADFLSRATHLWDGEGAFGQLQNQAYGYLWPMGPFFLVGAVLDLPGWVIQRLWMGLVMSVAFVGAARVSRALGIRSDLACLVAGFAYALSPRMLTTLGPISIEAWPSALVPWVLLPLILGSTAGSPRRAAALSALAVAMVGGVNAAATFAVLPLGVIWLLTRTPGPRRRSLMLWWPVFTALGTLWWLIPLFLLGTYSPPFLDYIETAAITTFPTTVFDALRGTSAWVPYIDTEWRAGNDLITDFYLPINSGVVLLLGFVGLMSRRNPHRQFLLLSVLVGLLMVTLGHLGSVQGWFAADLHDALDGVLAPIRNVHKFDPVLRLPLVLGLAWAVEAALVRREQDGRPASQPETGYAAFVHRANRFAVLGLALVAVVGASMPALVGRIAPTEALLATPDYWQETADWLESQPGDGPALLVPGSSFGSYVWGTPRDEPMQFLADSPWAVRNAIPLAPAGNIRMLDAFEERLAQGEPSRGLADYLRRAGVGHLVVRNDLKRSDDVPDPVLVHQALEGSPGLERVMSFGPDVGGDGHVDGPGERVVINDGWQSRYPAVEIFEVVGGGARAVSSEHLPIVSGGPEDLLDLADLGLIGQEPTQLALDAGPVRDLGAPLILTDGLRDRERFFGRVHDGTSATITPGDERRTGNPVRDYELEDQSRWSTTVRLTGARALSASSSLSDANAAGGAQPGTLPFAAVDGSRASAWVSGTEQKGDPWWQMDLAAPAPISSVTVTGGPSARDSQLVRVRTAGDVSDSLELGPGETRIVRLDAGETPWVRVEGANRTRGARITLAEVVVGSTAVQRSLVLPALPERWGLPDRIVLRAAHDARTGCVSVELAVRCAAGRDRAAEEPVEMSRFFSLPESTEYEPSITVRPVPGEALGRLLQRDQLVKISSSSAGIPDVRASAIAAIDGRPGTTWVADADELRPSLNLTWVDRQKIAGIRLSVAPAAGARMPNRITLVWPSGRRSVELDSAGRASFAPIRTDQLELRIEGAESAFNLGFDGSSETLPIGVSELRLSGVPYLPLSVPRLPLKYPCGTGPTLSVNGETFETALKAAPSDIFAMKSVPARVCKGRTLGMRAGENHIEVVNSDAFAVDALVLDWGTDFPAEFEFAGVTSSDSSRRVEVPSPGARTVSLRENTNPGWRATRDGQALEPVVVDGWQQGWSVPPGEGDLRVFFAPEVVYRGGLVVGLLGLLALAGGLALSPRGSGASRPALRPRRIPTTLLLGAALVGGGLLAGNGGVGVIVAALIGTMLLRRWDEETARWLLAGAVLVAATAYGALPWGNFDGWGGNLRWPHYLALFSLAGALAMAVENHPKPAGRLRRMLGRSTTR